MEPFSASLAAPVQNAPDAPRTSAAPPAPVSRPLDLSQMAPPGTLAEARLEDISIDGICGVY